MTSIARTWTVAPWTAALLVALAVAWSGPTATHAAELPAAIPALTSIEIQPKSAELRGPRDRFRVLVMGVTADGRRLDVSAAAKFQSTAPQTAPVAANGEVTPAAEGAAEIRIEVGGKSATLPVTVAGLATPTPPSFLHEVLPLLTRAGCNQGACHGKGAGQNGFRLSLRGYAPEWDHDWLTREYQNRRVNPLRPADSLILTKSVGRAPHGGGRLFGEQSREHHLLIDWIVAGMPAPSKDDIKLTKVEVLPGNLTVTPGQTQQLLVRATFGDGQVRDVTWLSKFASNDASVIEVTPTGLVKVVRQGETAIRVTFEDAVEIVTFTVPYEGPVDAARLAAKNNFIDDHVMRKLAALRIPPSDPADDATFLRRVYLDTIGSLPTPEEIRKFYADTRTDKRTKLIDELLARPEFTDYWSLQLGDLFQNRKERDHDVRGSKGVRAFHAWIREQVAKNRPWDELVRDVLTSSGSTQDCPQIGYFVVTVGEKRKAEESEVVDSVAQALLGIRVGCARCHNHPLEKYTQDDYYHFAGFFSRIRLDRKKPDVAPTSLAIGHPDDRREKNNDKNKEKPRPVGVNQPRTNQFLAPRPLDRSAMEITPEEDPRAKLAAWMTAPENTYFTGAITNRIWKHFLGVGLVEPVDDLRASNPPSNPELWAALHQDFVAHKYDLRHLVRTILNSRTYQLSSETLSGNRTDSRYYSRYYARRLPAEVLLDALSQATGVPESFPGYPQGVRAIQLPDPAMNSYFLSLFGRSERVTACACERSGDVTMPQLLHLQNSEKLYQKLRSGEGRLMQLVKQNLTDEKLIEELFLATYSRLPRSDELQAITKSRTDGGEQEARQEFLVDLCWALVNGKEFTFNH